MFFSAINWLNLWGVTSDLLILGLCLSIFIYLIALYILLCVAVTVSETIRDWRYMTMPMFVIGCFGGLFIFGHGLINRIKFRDIFEVNAPTQHNRMVRRLVWNHLRGFSMRLKEMFDRMEALEHAAEANPTPNQIDQIMVQKRACGRVESLMESVPSPSERNRSTARNLAEVGGKDFLATYDETFNHCIDNLPRGCPTKRLADWGFFLCTFSVPIRVVQRLNFARS